MSSVSGPWPGASASSSSSLPRRRTSANVAPSSALSGGSNVLRTLMPGVSTDSIVCPGSSAAGRRAVSSISGSSGTNVHVSLLAMDPWIREAAAEIGKRAPRELEALVAVSSPSGDVHGADECASVCAALLPDEATIERVPCSSPDHAQDLIARLHGSGRGKALLVGHVDTVVAHGKHRPLQRVGEQLLGSGSVDMKGGDGVDVTDQ